MQLSKWLSSPTDRPLRQSEPDARPRLCLQALAPYVPTARPRGRLFAINTFPYLCPELLATDLSPFHPSPSSSCPPASFFHFLFRRTYREGEWYKLAGQPALSRFAAMNGWQSRHGMHFCYRGLIVGRGP